MARRKRSGGGGGASWMDTYGDMVTLLLAFFVLLFSFSTIESEKWEAIVGALSGTGRSVVPDAMSLSDVVNAPISLEVTSVGTREEREEAENEASGQDEATEDDKKDEAAAARDLEKFNKLVATLQLFIDENKLAAELLPEPDTFTVTMRIRDNIFFSSGDARIKPEAKPLIASLSSLFVDNTDIVSNISIEGHTDTDPIRTAQYKDNWDLSSNRATNTLRELLLNENIAVEKLRATGLGEHHPVETNSTPEGKAENRRVDFVIQSVVESKNR